MREEIITPAWYRPPEAAKYLSISRRHLTELTAKGIVPVARIGKKLTLYSLKDLDAAISKFKTKGGK